MPRLSLISTLHPGLAVRDSADFCPLFIQQLKALTPSPMHSSDLFPTQYIRPLTFMILDSVSPECVLDL